MPLMIYCPGCTSVGFYFSCHEAWSLRLPGLTAALTVAELINVVFWQSSKGREGRGLSGKQQWRNVFFYFDFLIIFEILQFIFLTSNNTTDSMKDDESHLQFLHKCER